jgi:hypothetical protein
MGTGSFPGVKRPGLGVDLPPPSSAEVKERVELNLYSPSGPSRPVVGWNLPLYIERISNSVCKKTIKWQHNSRCCELFFVLFPIIIIIIFYCTRYTEKYTGKIMCIIVDILINSLFCILKCMLLTCRPNFVEGAFAGLVFVHHQVPRHWHAFRHKQQNVFYTENFFKNFVNI